MIRIVLPIILVAAAIGLFVVYTDPTYNASKSVAAQVASYDEALSKSQDLKKIRDEKLAKYATFSVTDKQKLKDVLPDNVDNIRLIIDINNIASRHNLTIKDPQLGTISDSRTARNALAAGSSGDAVGSVDIGFSIVTNYDNMLAFLADIEHSLRLIDVEKLQFTTSTGQPGGASGAGDNYGFTIRTYWLH